MGAAPILTILKNGETVKSCPIEGEAVLGRGEGCVIRLEDRAISRQHAVFRKVADGIQLEKKSEFAPLSVNGAECSQALLKEGDVISIGPYLLRLSVPKEAPVEATAPQAKPSALDGSGSADAALAISPASTETADGLAPGSEENALSASDDPLAALGAAPLSEDAPADPIVEAPSHAATQPTEMVEEDGRTKVTAPEKLAVKLIFQPGQANVEEYEFTKDEISIGRGKNCDIVLNDKKASRKNSIIRRAGMSFSIKDLGSANGTYVNGERVTEHELTGQDKVRIGDIEFDFQAMSADYVAGQADFLTVPKEEAAPEAAFDYSLPSSDAVIAGPDAGFAQAPGQEFLQQQMVDPAQNGFVPGALPGALPGQEAGTGGISGIAGIGTTTGQPKSLLARLRSLPPKRQIPYVAVIIAVVYFAFFDDEEPQKKAVKAPPKKPAVTATAGAQNAKNLLSFESLTPDQKKFVEAQHSLAFDYYKNKEYDKALFEIGKIFDLVNDYKDSREIERYAKEGKRKMEALAEERRRKEEEARLKAKITQLEDETRARMLKKQYDQARELFPQILALDPENQNVEKWRGELEKVEESKRLADQRVQVQNEVNAQAWSVYRDGLALKRKHKFHSAISIFEKVKEIGASDKRVLVLSRKMIARSYHAIKMLREPLLKEGHEAETAGEFAKAYHAYESATKVDPPHPEGYAGMNRVKGVLHDRAKILYTEAVLAESYSDFQGAKKKFNECLEVAPKDDVYYERAERKLARYFKRGEDVSQ